MGLTVQHLNCATMCPLAPNSLLERMVCHCLIVETPRSGLVLVDTGFGMADVRGETSIPGYFKMLLGAAMDPAETALQRVRDLGYDPRDVRHIVVTHLDLDHAGGIPDFPHATVHVHAPERAAIDRPRGFFEDQRYIPEHWAHGPKWATYEPDGEPWFGFDAVRDLDELPPEILIIPLAGHSMGHSGVAVESEEGWLLHAGDAYFSASEVVDGSCPLLLRGFQRYIEEDHAARLHNQARLRELNESENVQIFCAHDPVELERFGS